MPKGKAVVPKSKAVASKRRITATKSETIAEIEAAAETAENGIGELQAGLQAEQRRIRRDAFDAGRQLTPQETQRLSEIDVAQSRLTAALKELSFVTLQNLDNSAEVQQLQSQMDGINRGLAGDLDRLKKLEEFSATAAKVADTIAQIVAKLAPLAAGALL
jgi:predicted  nucleic acid-binding Zn-ribbon protein